jgi:hypothetical protein
VIKALLLQEIRSVTMTRKVIKDTKYCQILTQGKLDDDGYRYCIEKIFIKKMKRDEIRFSLYKDT